MSHFPRLTIDLQRLIENAMREVELFHPHGISIMGVNKVFSGDPVTARALLEAGMEVIAEARLEALEKLQLLREQFVKRPFKLCLLRSPSLEEMPWAHQVADVILYSSLEALKQAKRICETQKKSIEVLLMLDMGDLREGIWFENTLEIEEALKIIRDSQYLSLYAIGTNFNCFGCVKPTEVNNQKLVRLAHDLCQKLDMPRPKISAGNCTSYALFSEGKLPREVGELRIGGLHLFGIDYVNTKYVDHFHHSQMNVERVCSPLYRFEAEIIELGVKPSMPVGERGLNAFLEEKEFIDRGPRKRAILNFGRLDVYEKNLWPIDGGVQILGQSSDLTIVDIQDSPISYRLGQTISFELDYTGLLFASNSPMVKKQYLGTPWAEL